MVHNADIRKQMIDAGVRQKQVAAQMGVSHEHLCRELAKDLTDKQGERILTAIEELKDVQQTV